MHRSNNFVATGKFELRLAFAHNFQVQSAYIWSHGIHVSFGSGLELIKHRLRYCGGDCQLEKE